MLSIFRLKPTIDSQKYLWYNSFKKIIMLV